MGWFSPDMQTMKDLFLHSMQDIYYAEHQIEKALPEMVEKASDTELKKGFRTHLKQTKGQIKRLDQAFKKLRVTPQGTKCPAIDGILGGSPAVESIATTLVAPVTGMREESPPSATMSRVRASRSTAASESATILSM